MERTKYRQEPLKKKHTTLKRYGKASPVDFLQQVYLIAQLGATQEEMATFFNVNITTLEKWIATKPEFAAAVRRGGIEFDMRVVSKLGQRAIGYEYTETEITDGPKGYQRKTTKKHVPGDVTAQIFWLKNRRRNEWTDVNRTEIYGQINHNLNINRKLELSLLTEPERELLKSVLIKQITAGNQKQLPDATQEQ